MMTPSNLTLQALLDKRRELDAQINALTSKRNEAIQSILKVMHNFAITIEDLREAQAQDGQSEQAQAPGARKTAKKAAKKTARRTSKSADTPGNEDRSITTSEPLSSPSASHIAPSLSDDLEMEIEPPTSIMDEQPVAQEESTAARPEPISRPIREYSYSEPFDDEDEDEDPNPIPQDIA